MHALKEKIKGAMQGHKDEETWYVTVERADGLKDRDKISQTDPYVKLHFGGSSHKTKAAKDTLSPEWNETFEFHLNPKMKKRIGIESEGFGHRI